LRYLKRNNRQVLRSPCCNAYLCGIRARVFIGGAATLRAAREKSRRKSSTRDGDLVALRRCLIPGISQRADGFDGGLGGG
jgi:hypothetical protein